jgi:hypothetical protein
MKKFTLAVITALFCLPAATWAQFSTHDLILEDNSGSPIVTLQAPFGGTPFQYVFPSTAAAVGAVSYISGVTGSQATASWLMPGADGQVLQLDGGLPTWTAINTLPNGSGTNTILVWDGTSWVSNSNFSSDPANGNTTIGGDLTVSGTNVNLPAGSISNTELENSSVTVNSGTGLSGGGIVPLGGSITLQNTGLLSASGIGTGIDVQTAAGAVTIENTGVTGLTPGNGISLSGSNGNVTVTNTGLLAAAAGTGIDVSTAGGTATISNTGVTSITGTPNQVIASGSTGPVTLSTPQDIHTGAAPTFAGMTLSSLTNDNTIATVVVSDGGVLKTRSIASLPGGFSGVTTNSSLIGDGLLTPLGLNLSNANTWSALQTFSSLATTGTTTLGDGGDNITLNATSGSLNLSGLTNDDTKDRLLVQDASTGQVYYRTASSLAGSSGWGLTGNAGTSPSTNFMGTTDAQDVVFRSDDVERARILSSGPVQLTSTSGSTGEIRFVEPTTGGGTQYSSINAQAQSGNIRYLLPDTAGLNGDVLLVKSYNPTTGEVVLDWAEANESGGVGTLLFSRKTANQIESGTTLQDDDHLQLDLDANTTYEISGALYYTASGNSELDLAWVVPGGTGTGSSNSAMLVSFFGNEVKSGNSNTGAGTRSSSGVGNASSRIGVNTNEHIIHFKGLVITGSTSGTLQLQWTPHNAQSITMRINSYMGAKIAEQ